MGKLIYGVTLSVFLLGIGQSFAHDQWREYCLPNKNIVNGDDVLETNIPPPFYHDVKFNAWSINAVNGHLWLSICNLSDSYLSVEWPIAGILVPTDYPLDPAGGFRQCACQRKTVDGEIEVGHDHPLYFVNSGNKKSSSAHWLPEKAAVQTPGELNSAIAFLGEGSGPAQPLLEFASSFSNGEISHYIFKHEAVAGLLFGIPQQIVGTKAESALTSLVDSSLIGIEIEPTTPAEYRGISSLPATTPLWRMTFSGDGDKPRLTVKAQAADIAYNVPVYAFNSDNVIIAGAGIDLFFPIR